MNFVSFIEEPLILQKDEVGTCEIKFLLLTFSMIVIGLLNCLTVYNIYLRHSNLQ